MRRTAWVLVAALAVAGCGELAVGAPAQEKPAVQQDVPKATEIAYARAKLPTLRTVTPDRTGYQRTKNFGPAWSVDVDRNGCGTRDDILRRDLESPKLKGRCTVIAGRLDDPYTGVTVTFLKKDADEVQIDHVVPLAAAWSLGARTWPQKTRERFANDPLNLIATSQKANLGKGDDTPSQWLPRAQYRCAYAVRYIRVSGAYGLGITEADRVALARAVSACPAGRTT